MDYTKKDLWTRLTKISKLNYLLGIIINNPRIGTPGPGLYSFDLSEFQDMTRISHLIWALVNQNEESLEKNKESFDAYLELFDSIVAHEDFIKE